MLNQLQNDKVSFEGKGDIKIVYHNYTDKAMQNLVEGVSSGLKSLMTDFNLKEVLLKSGIINEQGDLIKLAPKRFVITGGNGAFDEKILQGADSVHLKGGLLEEPLTAKNVYITHGAHSGIIADSVNILHGDNANGVIKADVMKARNVKLEDAAAIDVKNAKFTNPCDG
jgi:hypothetical protein